MKKNCLMGVFVALALLTVTPAFPSTAVLVSLIDWTDVFNNETNLVLIGVHDAGDCDFDKKGSKRRFPERNRTFICDGEKWIAPDGIAVQ